LQTTKPSTGADIKDDHEEWLDENSQSNHSFDYQYCEKLSRREYISTSLVTGRNISLADVIVENVTRHIMEER
jgi:hypothetical protein